MPDILIERPLRLSGNTLSSTQQHCKTQTLFRTQVSASNITHRFSCFTNPDAIQDANFSFKHNASFLMLCSLKCRRPQQLSWKARTRIMLALTIIEKGSAVAAKFAREPAATHLILVDYQAKLSFY
eukprot:6207700-Pleurochrysis_carterae.AAC.3